MLEGSDPIHAGEHRMDSATEGFAAHRNLLCTVAYEMLGSAADAEDVPQETWLQWIKVDLAEVRDQRAYLVRITTRYALDRLRTMKRRKEAYVGSWLPEPMLTALDVAEDFVLREVFDVGYDDIADAVGRTPAAVRQIAHRARRHVDGGGVKKAATRPVIGADRVARFIFGSIGKAGVTLTGEHTVVNGNPALLLRVDGEVDGVIAFRVEDAITGLYYVRNPAKLTRLTTETPLTLR